MTPVTWWDYPVWASASLLLGLIAATYVRGRHSPSAGGASRAIDFGILSSFAVGCPICNELVVALVGVSGALNYWAPVQPVLGLASIGMLLVTLVVRLRGLSACSVRPAAA